MRAEEPSNPNALSRQLVTLEKINAVPCKHGSPNSNSCLSGMCPVFLTTVKFKIIPYRVLLFLNYLPYFFSRTGPVGEYLP